MAIGEFLGNPLVAGALSLGSGLAQGYAKERQTQSDHRRRMAEISYRNRLGQMNRSMEQTNRRGIQTPSGETIMPDDPRYAGLAAAKDFAAGGGSVGQLQAQNDVLTGRVGDLRNKAGSQSASSTAAAPEKEPPTHTMSSIFDGVARGDIKPSAAFSVLMELPEPDDPRLAAQLTDYRNIIGDYAKKDMDYADKARNKPSDFKPRKYEITTREELMEYIKQLSPPSFETQYGDPTSMGGGGDPAGNAVGTQVAIGPNQVMPKSTLDAMNPEQFAALERQLGSGGFA